MPDYPHIAAYYARRRELVEFGGSDNELNIRPAFQNCLDAYCREHKERLVLIPELKTAGNVIPDGTVKDTLRMARGYWEAKDSHDDLDAEMQAKFNRGYPKDNIVFEDSETAVLVQNGDVALRVDMSRPGELHRLIRRFLDYELPSIEEFRQAQAQFKADLPAVLENLRQSVAAAGDTLFMLTWHYLPATPSGALKWQSDGDFGGSAESRDVSFSPISGRKRTAMPLDQSGIAFLKV